MLNTICKRMFGLARGIYRTVPWTRFFTGLGAGWVLLAFYQQFLSQLGCSSLVISAVWCLSGLAWALAWGCSTSADLRENTSSTRLGLLGRGLGIPVVLLVLIFARPRIWTLYGIGLSDATLGSPWMLFGYACIWAAVMLALPVWCVARLALVPQHAELGSGAKSVPVPSALFVFGIAFGVLSGVSFSFGNLYTASLFAGLLMLASQASSLRSFANKSPWHSPSIAQFADTPTAIDAVGSALIALSCGGLLVWLTHVVGLLLVTSLYTFVAIVAGSLAGIALGLRMATAPAPSLRQRRLWTTTMLVAVLLMLTAGFAFVVYRLVTLTGTVSQVWLLQGIRDAFVALLVLPIGMLWALSSATQSSAIQLPENRSFRRWISVNRPATGIILAMLGGALAQGVLIPGWGLSATAYGLLFCVSATVLIEVIRRTELPTGLIRRGALTACGLALIVSPLLSRGIRPELASRLLFSTNVFLAEKSGIPRSQLPFMDDSRLDFVQSSEHGVLSVWKSAVSRFQIRENGIQRGVVSTNGAIAPQPSADVLTSLLPMTLHEQPRHVAVMGLGAGVPLLTCLGNTDVSVTLVESDPGLISVVRRLTANTDLDRIWQEERLKCVGIDPVLWVGGAGNQFDVVISNTDQSALLRSSPLFTQDFYRRAAGRLTSDGIFCQRFAFHDFGPGPLQTLSATLRSVFSNVMMVEIGPGEVAFLATNSSSGLVRSDVVGRMQNLYSSEAMAGVGWDWSVLLTLGAYDAEHLDKIEAAGRPRINSATNGLFCTTLPHELMRWGPKAFEVSRVLQPNTGKILNWLGEVSERDDLLRRLSEVRGQQELLANYPDQYWAYRAQVRKQVSTRPLSLIQKVKHEDGRGGLHPEDKRRLRYFQQLSKAIHSKSPREIERLEAFTVPYDPLVSLFVHQELAEIASRVPGIDPQLELEHRLHTLFFTSSNDRSVRNALATLRLILDKPSSVPVDADRFDTLNTVLQALQYRWEARTSAAPGNASEVARDVEENIVLAERALVVLSELAPDAGVSASDCEARRRVLEHKLLHPLRNYRARLEPHVTRQKMKAQAGVVDGELPTDEELQFPGADKE